MAGIGIGSISDSSSDRKDKEQRASYLVKRVNHEEAGRNYTTKALSVLAQVIRYVILAL